MTLSQLFIRKLTSRSRFFPFFPIYHYSVSCKDQVAGNALDDIGSKEDVRTSKVFYETLAVRILAQMFKLSVKERDKSSYLTRFACNLGFQSHLCSL